MPIPIINGMSRYSQNAALNSPPVPSYNLMPGGQASYGMAEAVVYLATTGGITLNVPAEFDADSLARGHAG